MSSMLLRNDANFTRVAVRRFVPLGRDFFPDEQTASSRAIRGLEKYLARARNCLQKSIV